MKKSVNRIKEKFSNNGQLKTRKDSVKVNTGNEFVQILQRLIKANDFISRSEMMSRMYSDCFSQVDERCGYPSEIQFEDYKYMYERDGVAARVVSVYPSSCWGVIPYVYEREDIETGKKTKFEKRWEYLVEHCNILTKMYRLDEISGIGHYGVALVGINDGKSLESAAYRVDKLGYPKNLSPAQRELLYYMPFDEGDAKIDEYEDDPTRARYGKPKYYKMNMVNPRKKGGSIIGSTERVHWTRCIHVADGCKSNDVIGTPRMKKVWNYLLNLRKIYGGSGQMFWYGGFPGIAFQVPAELAGQVDLDKESLSKEIEEYYLNLKRYMALEGVEANQLKPNIADPKGHVEVELEAVCIGVQCPIRYFKGTEEARLASMQDTGNWHSNVKLRLTTHCTPNIVRPTVDLFMATGIMPYVEQYYTGYPDLDATSEKDKADIAAKLTRALMDYMKGGVSKLIPPLEFLSMMLNMTPEQAEKIIEAAGKAAKNKKYKFLEPTEGELKMAGKHPSQQKTDTRPRNTSTGRRPASGTTRKVKQV